MTKEKNNQTNFFIIKPGVIFFTCQSYIVRYLQNPGLPPEALEDYVNAKLSKIYPAHYHEIKADCEIIGNQIKIVIMKNKIIEEALNMYPKSMPVCAVKGLFTPKTKLRRIVVLKDFLDITIYDHGIIVEKYITLKDSLQILLKDNTTCTQLILDKNNLQELPKIESNANIELISFQDTFFRSPKQYVLFNNLYKPQTTRLPLIALVTCFLLANILAMLIRNYATGTLKTYENQIKIFDQLIKENYLLDKELANYKTGTKMSEFINPGKILILFVSTEQHILLKSFSFEKNRFVIQGTAKNAIAFVEALKATNKFVNLSLSSVQPEADGIERFSLSGEYYEQP